MGDPAIRAEGLSKLYEIGGRRMQYATLRDTLADVFLSPFLRMKALIGGGRRPHHHETIWALDGVSFEIGQGEVVGVIGRNGAGKSTLLKVLSRITEPTSGTAELRGRVGSLLEVGTGFHPELTGRENIYLNGAILGMKRGEINSRLDEIVSFAEVEKFIDTPVKHYSSGMYLRLAFAVAAHLEPEILIVDEVLAVGDSRFQRKCLNKMQRVGREGRTVLFVSHNMQAISRLCRRAILLDEGRVLRDGSAGEVVAGYLNMGIGIAAVREWPDPSRAPQSDVVRLRAVRVRDEDGPAGGAVDVRQPVGIEVEYEVLRPGHLLVPVFSVTNEEELNLFTSMDQDPKWRRVARPEGCFRSTAWIPGNLLAEGTMLVSVAVVTEDPFVLHCSDDQVVAFHVIDRMNGDSARGDYAGRMSGAVRPLLKWTTQFSAATARGDSHGVL